MTYMTIEQFRQLHEEWKQSGLSVQQYCENTGLKPKSVIRKNFLSFLMTAIRKLALYKLDL